MSNRDLENVSDSFWLKFTALIFFIILAVIILGMWGCPNYDVYQKTLSGEAELKKAEWNRQITVKEAEAKLNSAKLLSDADIIRAKGAAEANKILGDSLKNNEAYLRYLWIQGLQDGKNEVIYIPTEAGLPMLEAGKRK